MEAQVDVQQSWEIGGNRMSVGWRLDISLVVGTGGRGRNGWGRKRERDSVRSIKRSWL